MELHPDAADSPSDCIDDDDGDDDDDDDADASPMQALSWTHYTPHACLCVCGCPCTVLGAGGCTFIRVCAWMCVPIDWHMDKHMHTSSYHHV